MTRLASGRWGRGRPGLSDVLAAFEHAEGVADREHADGGSPNFRDATVRGRPGLLTAST
jgi:hypothetical protein